MNQTAYTSNHSQGLIYLSALRREAMRKPPRYSPQTFQATCYNEMKHSHALRETVATATSERTPTTTIYIRRTCLFMTTDNGWRTHVKQERLQIPRVAFIAETVGFKCKPCRRRWAGRDQARATNSVSGTRKFSSRDSAASLSESAGCKSQTIAVLQTTLLNSLHSI